MFFQGGEENETATAGYNTPDLIDNASPASFAMHDPRQGGRYAIRKSEHEEEFKMQVNSPLSGNFQPKSNKRQTLHGGIQAPTSPPLRVDTHINNITLTHLPDISPISQEDIENRPTFEEVQRIDNFNGSIISHQHSENRIKSRARQNVPKKEADPLELSLGKGKSLFGAIDYEKQRQEKLENLKQFARYKKVVDYESDTIELYDMISTEFDYEDLRINSSRFNIKQYKDGIYRGEINKKKKRHGKGVIVYDTGRVYEGQWKNDLREGSGYELFTNGNVYQGQYSQGKAHGKGIYQWRNGEVFDGEWKNGKKDGSGVWKGIHGESFIGQWKEGKANGFGVNTWIDGDRYEGEWKDFLRHGNGTDFFINGDVYVGQYNEGKPSGYGQYKWANGNTYQGEFVNGMKHGKGKWKKAASDPDKKQAFNQYEGYYYQDKKHGYGEFTWESGNKYAGNYHDDDRQGYGIMQWTDGSVYKGHWEKGVQHGIGVMSFADGKQRAGFFKQNIFTVPLTDLSQVQSLSSELPEELMTLLREYLQKR